MAFPSTTNTTEFSEFDEPRALVKLFGNYYVPTDFTVIHNAHGATDEMTVHLPIVGNDPITGAAYPDLIALTGGTQVSAYPVSIYAGFPADPNLGGFSYKDLSTRFDGMLDQIKPNYTDNLYEITGRSWAAVLIETKTTANWQGYTTTQLVQFLAAKHNLTPNIQLRSGQIPATVMQVYGQTFTIGTRNFQEWDLILACAQADDADVWIDGRTLNYIAPELVSRPRVYLEWGKNVSTADGIHSASFSKFVEVVVRSYLPKETVSTNTRVRQDASGNVTITTKQVQRTRNSIFGTLSSQSSAVSIGDDGSVTTVSGTSTASGGPSSSGTTNAPGDTLKMRYIFHIPGLTKSQCDARALSIWRDISAHELVLDVAAPVTKDVLPNLNSTSVYQLSGLPTPSANVPYYAKRIEETFGVSQDDSGESEGWKYAGTIVNHALPTGGGL